MPGKFLQMIFDRLKPTVGKIRPLWDKVMCGLVMTKRSIVKLSKHELFKYAVIGLIGFAIVLTIMLIETTPDKAQDTAYVSEQNPAELEPEQPAPTQRPSRAPELTQAKPGRNAVLSEHIDIILGDIPVGTLNPLSPMANNSSTNQVFTMIFDRLLEFDFESMELVPSLAKSWDTNDYRIFNFKLR